MQSLVEYVVSEAKKFLTAPDQTQAMICTEYGEIALELELRSMMINGEPRAVVGVMFLFVTPKLRQQGIAAEVLLRVAQLNRYECTALINIINPAMERVASRIGWQLMDVEDQCDMIRCAVYFTPLSRISWSSDNLDHQQE